MGLLRLDQSDSVGALRGRVRTVGLQALLEPADMDFMASVDPPTVSVGPCGRRRFGRRTHGGRFAATFLILIAVFVSITERFEPGLVAVFLAFGCPALIDDLLGAVTMLDDGVRLTGFRLPRTLRYAEIAHAQLGETRYGVVVKTVDLIPTQGRRLRIVPFQFTGFYGQDGWAAELIVALQSHHIDVDADLLEHLTHAASRSAASVREEQAAYDQRKQDPPISF